MARYTTQKRTTQGKARTLANRQARAVKRGAVRLTASNRAR